MSRGRINISLVENFQDPSILVSNVKLVDEFLFALSGLCGLVSLAIS